MHITTTMYHQVTPRSVDHLIQVVDDEPNKEMEENLEEEPREPTEEIEGDSEGYSEKDPNLYDPRDGGMMHMEDEPVPTVEDAYSEYGSIGLMKGKIQTTGNGRSTNPQRTTQGHFMMGTMTVTVGRLSFSSSLLKVPYGLSL